VVLGDIRGIRKRCLGMARKLLTDARENELLDLRFSVSSRMLYRRATGEPRNILTFIL
jgi:hypothetical protein